jgi:hypothetical protein
LAAVAEAVAEAEAEAVQAVIELHRVLLFHLALQ